MYGFNEVVDGIFVGSRFVVNGTLLNSLKVTHLLSVDGFKDFPPGFTCKTIDVEDEESEDIFQYFQECVEFIKGKRIFVFCTAGRSRSVTVVAAYLMKVRNLNVQDALAMIREVRRINPNPGFLKQLEMWQVEVCELCAIEKKSDWFIENDSFLVIRCEQCDLPMVVLKSHTMKVTNYLLDQMKTALGLIADQELSAPWYIDRKQRSIYGHLHWHARPLLFKI